MNTANLQMEGVLLALAALCSALKRRGILSEEEISEALVHAEQGAVARTSQLRDANTEAVRFPIRFLRQALQQDPDALDFASIAADIGRARDAKKDPID